MTETKTALITGIAGQDGSHLADLLVGKGYEVHGIVRRCSDPQYPNIQHLLDTEAVQLHEADLCDQNSLTRTVRNVAPDEVYNLGAQSHVGTSFTQPRLTFDVTGYGAARVFLAVKDARPTARVYQASSSEMYGNVIAERGLTRGLTADDPMLPASPYGAAKLWAHHMARIYRQRGLYVACGILHNHEGPRRGRGFVTRKITTSLARMAAGKQKELCLGNLNAVRDWGWAPEFVAAAWRLLQLDQPRDLVVCTGVRSSVKEFLDYALRCVVARGYANLKDAVHVSSSEMRPYDIAQLCGNPGQAAEVLGWRATKMYRDVAEAMVDHDLRREGLLQ